MFNQHGARGAATVLLEPANNTAPSPAHGGDPVDCYGYFTFLHHMLDEEAFPTHRYSFVETINERSGLFRQILKLYLLLLVTFLPDPIVCCYILLQMVCLRCCIYAIYSHWLHVLDFCV